MENNCEVIYAFADGATIELKKVKDEVFASYTLGKGVAINPSANTLYAPCDGVVETVADTCHALTMKSAGGAQILLHVGIDTVNLRGTFFDAKVKPGKSVKKGDKLIEFQREKIEYEGYDTTICLAVCNTDEYERFEITDKEKVTEDDVLITLCR